MGLDKKNIYLLLTSLFIAGGLGFLAGEIYVRQNYPYWTPSQALKYSSAVFSRHVLSDREHLAKKNAKPPISFHINRHGYRGEHFSFKKNKHTTRVIVYGGSQVFDSRVSSGNDWPRRAESVLEDRGFDQVEVINAGIPGHASTDAVGRLFAEGHLLDPDFVILCNTWNDLKYFHVKKPLLRHLKPYKEYRDEVRFYQNFLDRFLGEYSQFYVRLRNDYFQWKYSLGTEGQKHTSPKPKTISDTAIKQFQMNIETFVNLARSSGATPVLMTQPSIIKPEQQSTSDRVKFHFTELTPDQTLKAFHKATTIIRNKAEQMNTPLFDGYKVMSERAEQFADHVHFNEKGSKTMGRKLADKIESLLKNRETRPVND